MVTESTASPIFLLGVPRSGTTLLRMMMDSHPDIMCGPEAPWITGRRMAEPVPNFGSLIMFLTTSEWGPVQAMPGVNEDAIYELAAALIDQVMSKAARHRGKSRWAEKTPENIISLPLLYRLFPQARFVHIYRDGRDVALSTVGCHWKMLHTPAGHVENTYENSIKRWVDWIRELQADAARLTATVYALRYEDLVESPEPQMRRLLEFIGVPWHDDVLKPYEQKHDLTPPSRFQVVGEVSFYERKSIDPGSLYRWKRELGFWQRRKTRAIADKLLLELGYEPTSARTKGG